MATSYPTQRRRFAFAAIEESTYGTDAGPTFTANAIRLEEPPDIVEEPLETNTREDAASGGLGRVAPAAPTGFLHRITARVIPLGAGVAYSASDKPNVDPLLVTAWSSTLDTTAGAESVTYALSDAPAAGASIYTEKAGKKWVTRGAVLESVRMEYVAGQFPVWEVVLVGIGDKPTEQDLEAATYSTVDPPPWAKSSGLSLGTWASPVVRSLTLDLNFAPSERPDGNTATVHQGYRLTDNDLSGEMVVEVEDLATYDPFDVFRKATADTLDAECGSTQYERHAIDVDSLVIGEPVELPGDGGLEVYRIPFTIHEPSSGSRLDLVFD